MSFKTFKINKMKKPYLLLLILFSTSLLSAQNETSKKELQNFSKIYKQVLDTPFDITSSMKKCVKQLNIPEERMAKILKSYFTGENVKLSSTEVKQLAQLKSLMLADKAIHDKKISKIIGATNMDVSAYKKMEKEYHQNVKLQKEVNQLSTKK